LVPVREQSSSPEAREEGEYGLKEDWTLIERTLSEVIPSYEKVNRFISLGTDLKIRREGISVLLGSVFSLKSRTENARVLDLGSGTGKMSQILLQESSGSKVSIVQLDALLAMMKVSKLNAPSSEQLLAIYEHAPFRPEAFDAAMAGFAIRDARNLSQSLKEIYYSIKPRGYFLIVDLSKPDSRTKCALIAIYWKVFSPLLATLASPRLGRKFASLFTTYRRLPTRSVFAKLVLASGFEVAYENYHMVGGSAVILLKRR
jgi:demethylmenaquinone methyltransferase/2-methoxy-6-polyprenyl-1,4-benzoquinol methylase